MTLCPWARHFTLLVGEMYLLSGSVRVLVVVEGSQGVGSQGVCSQGVGRCGG